MNPALIYFSHDLQKRTSDFFVACDIVNPPTCRRAMVLEKASREVAAQ
jgi:hypothetical protein